MKPKPIERVLFWLITISFLLHAAVHLRPALVGTRFDFLLLVPILTVFSLAHACYMLGWQRAAAFLCVCVLFSFSAELIGTITGFPFGEYEYTDVLGPKILNLVPFIIPFSWFMMLYSSFVIANLIVDGQPTSKPGPLHRIVLFCVVGALVMTAWDIIFDPYMVDIEKAWIWHSEGQYLGIPFLNFFGWVLTSFIALFVYRLIERGLPEKPLGAISRRMAFLPMLTYAFIAIADITFGYPAETILISPFAMGFPILAAGTRLTHWQPATASPR